jgi:hypothetical protein
MGEIADIVYAHSAHVKEDERKGSPHPSPTKQATGTDYNATIPEFVD